MATKFQNCMKKALKGKKFKTKTTRITAFKKAAKACGRKSKKKK